MSVHGVNSSTSSWGHIQGAKQACPHVLFPSARSHFPFPPTATAQTGLSQSVSPSIYPSTHSILPSAHPSHAPTQPPTHQFIPPHPCTYLPIQVLSALSLSPSAPSTSLPPTHPLPTYPPTHPFIHLTIYPSFIPSIHLPIIYHLSIYPPIISFYYPSVVV